LFKPMSMMIKRTIAFIFVSVGLILFTGDLCLAGQRPLRVLFFYPTSTNNTYWPQVLRLMESASEDLNIKFIPHSFGVKDRFAKVVEGKKILRQSPKADGAIFSVAFGQTHPLLEIAEELKIPSFIHGPLFPSELQKIGGMPRKTFKSWIGYFNQDEEKKGYLLAVQLLKAARKAGQTDGSGRVQMVGLGGDYTWQGSFLRNAGLLRAVSEDEQALLHQVVPTQWLEKKGERAAMTLLDRYPEVSVIWAASDQLSAGAVRAFKKKGRIPGRTGFTGGLDLSPTGLQKVLEGEMVATSAALLVSFAQILVLLHDHLLGFDFKADTGVNILLPSYTATAENARQHLLLLKEFNRIDFRNYSKYYHPDLDSYDFSFKKISQEILKKTP
jgi:ABC-type sugar transport system substrate-binding protein